MGTTAAGRARIVGRESEVAAVRALVDALPTGGVLVIEGEAGIGKSTLIDTACARAAAAGAVVVRNSADEFTATRPFGMLHDAVGLDGTAAGGADLDAALGAFERLSDGRPLLIAFDDLQWADSASLALLGPLVRRIVPAGTAVILALRSWPRPVELDQLLDRLVALEPAHVELGPLSDAELSVLAALELGRTPSRRLAAAVRRCGGNPFYVLSLLAGLSAEGRLSVRDAAVDVTGDDVGGSLHRVVSQRVRMLGPDATRALRTAALLGRTFDLGVLARLEGRSPASLAGLVTEAVDAGVLAAAGNQLSFRHDLVREALEQDLPAAVRSAVHRDIVDVLVERGAPPADLAPHLLRAELAPRDVDLLAAAAAASTPAVGAQLLGLAASLLEDTDPRRMRFEVDRIDALSWSGRADEAVVLARTLLDAGTVVGAEALTLHAAISHALFLQGRAAEAVDSWPGFPPDVPASVRAAELAEVAFAALFAGRLAVAQEHAEEARALSDDPTAVTMTALVLAFVHLAGGDIDRAVDEAERAVAHAPGASETAWRFGPHMIRGMVRDVLGDTEGALADLSRASGQLDDLASAVRVPFRHVLTANALFRAGRWDDAQAEVDAGLGACDDLGVRAPEAWLVSTAALLALGRDGVAPAKEIVARAGTAQLGADQVVWTTGLLAALEGDLATALSLYALVAEIGDALGSRTSVAMVAADLVRAALALGDTARVDWLCTAFAWADGSRSVPMRGHHLWATGLAAGDPARVAAAVDVLGSVRPFDAARARHDVARLLTPSDPSAARTHAFDAIEAFEALGATTFANLVRADMATAGIRLRAGRRAAARFGWEAVTATERQVLELLADGSSNASIAERLFMSRRTVESHLAHVYAKVGISSRVELVRHLVAHDDWRA